MGDGDVSVLALHLTGSPSIERAVIGGEVSVTATAERVQETFSGTGSTLLLEERLRPMGEIRWSALREGQLLGLVADVSKPEWTLGVRLARGQEVGTPLTLRVRTVSALPLTAGSGRRDWRTARPLAEMVLRWRALDTYTAADLGLTTIALT